MRLAFPFFDKTHDPESRIAAERAGARCCVNITSQALAYRNADLIREKLDPDTTLLLEHPSQEEYPIGAEYVRGVVRQNNFKLN